VSAERFAERKTELNNALQRLREAAAQPETDLVRDAVFQRFEFTIELLWKCIKLYLERQGTECGGPRPTFKGAFAEGLIDSPEEADAWMRALEDRNLTSHVYDEALATRIFQHVTQEYLPLFGRMTAKIQTLVWE